MSYVFLSKRLVSFLIVGLMLGATIGFLGAFVFYEWQLARLFTIPDNVTKIAREMRVEIWEGDNETRELFLDPDQYYCRHIVFYGGADPFPWDLAYPYSPIVFFFLEDIEDPRRADNYGDLVVRMNLIIDEEDGKLKMVVVFFAEGGYDKLVYYKGELIYHYMDSDPTSNYGIKEIPINEIG